MMLNFAGAFLLLHVVEPPYSIGPYELQEAHE
jgi:hypothetical protein